MDNGPEQLVAMVAGIEELVNCESPSNDLDALARSADVVAAVGTSVLGVSPERITLGGCPHLRWRFGPGPVRIVLLAHHDTVWPIGTLAAIPFTKDDGIIRGPGCFDMKAGLVIGLHALAAVGDLGGVSLLVTGDEEIGSPTSRRLIEDEAHEARAVLVLEPAADGRLKTQRKGVSAYAVSVTGRAAHAGLEPEAGINAAIELAHQVLAIAGLADEAAGTTVTPTVLSAGLTTNTVPASARVMIDVRAASAAEQDRVDRALRSLAPVVRGAALEVTGGINRPPLPGAASAELFARASPLAARLGIGPLESVAVGGGSDGNFTAALGIPTLDGLGAVGAGAHADHEHVVIADLVPRAALVSSLVAELR